MDRQNTLRQRLRNFIILIAVVATITGVVIISNRLSNDSLALIIGLVCGVSTMLPTIALGVFLWRREEQRKKEARERQQQYQQPPVIVIAPQGMPGYGPQNSLPYYEGDSQPWPDTRRSQREFRVVGEE